MESEELSNMRLKQVAVTNGMMLTTIIFFFIMISIFTITYTHFFLALGVITFIQGIFGLVKGDSTKSWLPILERVAIYEKQKMGSEWYKQRKVGYIWNLLLSCLLFLQSYWHYDSMDILQMEWMFMIIIILVLFVMVNISLIIHFRKVDQSTSELDMKGYTWKSNVIGVVMGIIFAFIMVIITLISILSGV